MDLREIDRFHIVGRVVVLDLPTSPVETLDLDNLVVRDLSTRGDCSLLTVEPFVDVYPVDSLSGCHRF